MKKTTTTKPVFNGSVHVEVKAETKEKALEIARAIPGLTVHEHSEPVAMTGGTFLLSGTADKVGDLPDGVTLSIKPKKQMH